MSKKREAKSTVSTEKGMIEVKVIIDLTPEDLIEHICKCVLGELSGTKVYNNLPNRSVLSREIKNLLIIRKT